MASVEGPGYAAPVGKPGLSPEANPSFAPGLPLQLAWDSTSMGALKQCPRYYQYTIVEGWVPHETNVHLFFGQVYHAALERYDHARVAGADHEDGIRAAVYAALNATWDPVLKRPWTSTDPNKNRLTLIRTIVWYLDQFAADPIQTLRLANGKPALELSFRFDTQYRTASGQPYLWCGHIDRVGVIGDSTYICDRKTTKMTLDESYFATFTPDNQFSGYSVAGQIVFGIPAIQGIMLDAAQIAVTFSRFLRQPIPRTPEQSQEWLRDIGVWLGLAETYALAGYWPMNDKACFRCHFRSICSKPASVRGQWLKAGFKKRMWNPLEIRGDI